VTSDTAGNAFALTNVCSDKLKQIILHDNKLKANKAKGAKIKTPVFAFDGIIISLAINFKPSAKG